MCYKIRMKNKWGRDQKSLLSLSTKTFCRHRSMRRKEKVPKMPRRKRKEIFILDWEGRVEWERSER